MTCPCKKECSGSNPSQALQITKCEPPVLFHKVQYPASLGNDTEVPPESLDYRNVLLTYEANNHSYLYSSDGIPTLISMGELDVEEIQAQIAALGGQLAEETTNRENADTELSGKIEANTISIEQNAAAIQTQQASLAELQQSQEDDFNQLNSAIGDLEDSVVQKDTKISGDASTVTLTKTVGALENQPNIDTALPLPVASETSAGVMNVATYLAVQENSENIDSILGGAVVLENLPAEPTDAELTAAWEQATGKTELINRASIYDEANKKVWYYYENANAWKPISTDGTEVTVSVATNDTVGIVKGSTEDGQVAVEADGSMSLNGYDAINSNIENLQSEMPKLPAGMVYDFVSPAGDNNPSTAENANITARVVETATGDVTSGTLMLPMASATQAGSITADNKQKLDNLPAITRIGEGLELTDEGVLNASGGSEYVLPPYVIPVLRMAGAGHVASISADGFGVKFFNDVPQLAFRTYNTSTGEMSSFANTIYTDFPEATSTKTGWMPAADKSKLDSLLEIKSLNDSLSLDENGQLSVVGGGSDVNLLNEYTASPAEGDVYNATYVNGRLDRSRIAIGKSAISQQATSFSDGGIAIGNNAKTLMTSGWGNTAIALGYNATCNSQSVIATNSAIAIGYSASVTNSNAGIAIGGSATTSNNRSVAIGSQSTTTRDYEVSFGKSDTTRVLANVTAGVLDTDAVNLKQMQDYVAEQVGNIDTALETLISGTGAN